ncbi:Cof-type HAD-IIB family hydrolase [Dethiobacter alkaliphilus]|uniref:Cof-type HAD-IIB family hydrolase n=1 Tax=Dethiobacter alkaliphilus TaxID=427926 RepID=UPI00222757D5|nr:Cof-type HAD-IIB family hydrolase [Dethiobacter alkaliphilus]MCW3488620.1 Cof-type HAD-IIB family hydrolase [Dethiobacter alkaliphilus]
MTFKLLALDLDDTLLGDDFLISPENRHAIRQAAKHGVLVTLATGRMFRSAVPFARELQIDLPLITYHGALIRTAGGEDTLYHRPVPLNLAQEMAELAAEENLHLNAYINDELFVARENELSRYYQNLAKVKVTAVGDLAEFLHTPPTKLTIINRDGWLDGIKDRILEQYGEELSITISRPHFLEITDRLATKGQALRFLAEKHNIPQAEVAAVGDSFNDLDMIIYAGMGVAVANAREEVKAVADIITSANTEHGVADFIYKYLFDGKEGDRHE